MHCAIDEVKLLHSSRVAQRHFNKIVNVLIGDVRILKGEIRTKCEEDMFRFVMRGVSLDAAYEGFIVCLQVSSLGFEETLHVCILLLIDIEINPASSLIQLMSNVSE